MYVVIMYSRVKCIRSYILKNCDFNNNLVIDPCTNLHIHVCIILCITSVN